MRHQLDAVRSLGTVQRVAFLHAQTRQQLPIGVIAQEIMGDLEAALEQMPEVAADLAPSNVAAGGAPLSP